MKKLMFYPLLMILTLVLISCDAFTKQELSIEMVAFNSLTDEERKLIPVSPKDSTVEKVTVNDEIGSFISSDYDKDQVYSITFNNTESDSSGNLTVLIDLDKVTIVGKGFKNK
ncbi:MAG TPA: hypothetical protein VEY70_05505 [Metabacillus sp.]|nr:hypothetical protein [Metabacillus sp.]